MSSVRGALHDLSDALLNGVPPAQLHEAVRHAWSFADRAELEENMARRLLDWLDRDLRTAAVVSDPRIMAQQLTHAGDRL